MNEFYEMVVGLVGVPVTQWLKLRYDFEGKRAQWLAFAVSFVLSVGVLALQGELFVFDVESLVEVVNTVFLTGFIGYRLLVKDN